MDGARAAIITTATHCGAPIQSTVLTDMTGDIGTDKTEFQPLPAASAIIVVPAGAQRCIKVTFSASASCYGAAMADVCYVQVLDNGNPTNPPLEKIFTSESQILAAHSFEWVKRAGPGNHVITVRIKVQNAGTHFLMSGWTMDIELTN
jgi:hypothetical protein